MKTTVSPRQEVKPPFLSVLLPVYNAEHYLRQSVSSILAQTFDDFELLALDDGSTDGSLTILREYEAGDHRLRVFPWTKNRGVADALNELIGKARGTFLARMDGDDVCLPDRFEKQVAFLRSSTEHVAVGGWVEQMNAKGQPIGIIKVPLNHDEIDRENLKGCCSIWNPSAMLKTRAAISAGGYSKDFAPAEDLEFWLRLAEIGKLANIPHVLLRYRLHQDSLSEKNRETQQERARQACEKAWARRGIDGTFEATAHWRPGKDRRSRHHFALRHGWVAWNHGHRGTWWTYARQAMHLKPFSISTWQLFVFGFLKRPRKGFL